MSEKAATECAIGDRDGMVVIEFHEPTKWAEFDPETARRMGEQLARSSYTAKYGKAPSQGSTISKEIRDKLVARTMHMIRSLQEKQAHPRRVAEEVVDTVLSEAL